MRIQSEMILPPIIQVNVSQRHIETGRRLSIDSCPFAIALNDEKPLWDLKLYTVMHHEHIWMDLNGNLITYSHSPEAVRFINDFDAGKRVTPGTFILTKSGG